MSSTKNIGPEGPLQPSGSREKRLPSDPEAFQKRLEKAGETDPEQKKKRRQQEEEVEELKDMSKEADKAARSKDTIAPFKLGKKGGVGLAGAPPLTGKEASAAVPMNEAADIESDFWDEDDFELPPMTQATSSPPASPVEARPTPPSVTPPPKKEEIELEVDVEPLHIDKAKRKEGEKEETPTTAMKEEAVVPLPPVPEMSGPTPAPQADMTPYTQLPPHVLALYERMAGVITVMTQTGVTETTVALTTEQFANSPFFGAEITIREYSTAPKQFNVEVKASPEAAAQFQANIPYLESSFRTGNYKFGIHRIETSIHRIEDEPVSNDEKDEEER